MTGRLAFLVAAGVVPIVLLTVLGVDAWFAAGTWAFACSALTMVDVLRSGPPAAVRVRRTLPSRVRLGDVVRSTVQIVNTGPRRLRGLVRDAWQPTAGAAAGRVPIDVPAGASRTLALALRPRRRGELGSEFVVIRSYGPLGLAGRQARIDAPGAVRVLPPFTSRRHLPSRIVRLRELDGNASVLLRGRGTEFDGLREYVRGDDVRSIDWRATARAGDTMLRIWRPERDRHVVVLIDTGRTAAVRVGDGTRLDAAMEAALLVGALAAQAGDHVHLVMFDRIVRARVTRRDGAALLPALVDAMASVTPRLIDTDWDASFAAVRRLGIRPSLLVVLTAQDSPDSARSFLAALPAVARAQPVLVGAATDGSIGSGAPTLLTVTETYRRAAAARAERDTARVAGAIARAGAEVLTATAEDLPPRLADRYLALKAAGRL